MSLRLWLSALRPPWMAAGKPCAEPAASRARPFGLRQPYVRRQGRGAGNGFQGAQRKAARPRAPQTGGFAHVRAGVPAQRQNALPIRPPQAARR